MSETVWLSLGSNLGDRRASLQRATAALADLENTTLSGVSSLYETAPWGDSEQGPYLNAVVELKTCREPLALLHHVQAIELALGRRRDPDRRWGPRTIDIDLLIYGGQLVDLPDLQLPHPRMHERAFVLIPLLDLQPSITIPGRGTALDLLKPLSTEGVNRIDDSAWYAMNVV